MSRDAAPQAARRRARRTPGERRAEIADAARALALEDGLAAVTLRAVAQRAGLTPALVSHYAQMDELVAATFSSIVSAELDEMAALAADERSPREALTAVVETLLDGSREDVTVVWVEAWALGRKSEALGAAVRERMDAWASMLTTIIERGVADGAFSVDDAGAAAWQLLGMIDGQGAQSLVRWGDARSTSDLLLRAMWGLLGAR